MSKVFYLFDTENDKEELWEALNAGSLATAIRDIAETLRREIKYKNETLSEEYVEALEKARRIVFEALESQGVVNVLD